MRAPLALLIGLIAAVGSLLAYPALLGSFERKALQVQLDAPDSTAGPGLEYASPNPEEMRIDGAPHNSATPLSPGLHLMEWVRRYQGGHVRRVGHTQLVGPFQDANALPCSTHLLVSQDILDDGSGSPQTMAGIVRELIEEQVADFNIWPLGKFKKINALSLQWMPWQDQRMLSGLRTVLEQSLDPGSEALSGHLRVSLDLAFRKGHVPLRVTIIPLIVGGKLELKMLVHAELDLDNRVYQLIADLFDGNDKVSQIVDGELSEGLRYILDKPPSIALESGSSLDLEFCKGRQLYFHPSGFVAVPLAIGISADTPPPPLSQAPGTPIDLALEAPLAIDIDNNGLNAIAHRLWSDGLLDKHLASSMVRSFNDQESVREFLSLRVKKAHFHLPPTLSLDGDAFVLRAGASAILRDGDTETNARLFTQVRFAAPLLQPGAQVRPQMQLQLERAELSCLPEPGVLRACYGQIVEQVRANQEPLQRMLSEAFISLLARVGSGREIGDQSTEAQFQLAETRFVSHEGQLRALLIGQLARIKE